MGLAFVNFIQAPALNLEWARRLNRNWVLLFVSQSFIGMSSAKSVMLKTKLTMCPLVLSVLDFPALLVGLGLDVVGLILDPVRFAFGWRKWGDEVVHD